MALAASFVHSAAWGRGVEGFFFVPVAVEARWWWAPKGIRLALKRLQAFGRAEPLPQGQNAADQSVPGC